MLCRKKFGLPPTGQVKRNAKQDGFDNVHDWLVFQATKEPAAIIAARSVLKAHHDGSAGGQPSRQGSDTAVAIERSASASRPVSAATRSTAGQAPAAGAKAAIAPDAVPARSRKTVVDAVKPAAGGGDAHATTGKPPLPRNTRRSNASDAALDVVTGQCGPDSAPAAPVQDQSKRRKASKRGRQVAAELPEASEAADASTPKPLSALHPPSAGLVRLLFMLSRTVAP